MLANEWSGKNKSREADLNHRPKDINISYYSPPLYQLSYHGVTNFLYMYIFCVPNILSERFIKCCNWYLNMYLRQNICQIVNLMKNSNYIHCTCMCWYITLLYPSTICFVFVSFLTVYSNGGVEGPDGKVNKSYVFWRISYLFGRITTCSDKLVFCSIGRIAICSGELGLNWSL